MDSSSGRTEVKGLEVSLKEQIIRYFLLVYLEPIYFYYIQAEAIWASLRPVLQKLLDEGVTKFIFVSDSPVNQYR